MQIDNGKMAEGDGMVGEDYLSEVVQTETFRQGIDHGRVQELKEKQRCVTKFNLISRLMVTFFKPQKMYTSEIIQFVQ